MKLISHFFQNINTLSYDLWTWWWQSKGANDEIARNLLSLTLVFFLFSWFTWIFIKKSNSKQVPLPPGPRGLPIVGNLPFLEPEFHSYIAGLARTYGPILTLRLGGKVGIVVSSPALASEVLKDNDVTFANRDVPAMAESLEYGTSDIVWAPYGPEWRMLRKICVHEVIGSVALGSIYSRRRHEIRNTIKYLFSQAGCPVNLGEQMFLTNLNAMTNMLWGGTVQGKERASIGAEFRQVVADVTAQAAKPNISDFFPGLARFDLQGIKKMAKEATSKLDQIFDDIIGQRLKVKGDGDGGKEGKDFLEVLLKLKDEGDAKTPLTMNHIKALLFDMVIGGSDSTTNTIEFAMAELMNKPQVMKKVQQEIESVVGKDNIVEESHLHKLHYLDAIIKEALRLHPALPLLVPHSPSESCIIGGYTVPKGARVFVNVWAIQRDPSVWENPLEFYPERFLDVKFDYTGNDFNYLPFGSGRRICAGTPVAERMLMFSLASLLHSFDWKLPAGEKLDLSEKFGAVLKKRIPLVAVPTPRLSESLLYN